MPSTRIAPGKCLDAIFRTHDEYSYARAPFQPKLSSVAEQISTHLHIYTERRRARDGEGASDKCERRGRVAASYCAARGADGYTLTRVP